MLMAPTSPTSSLSSALATGDINRTKAASIVRPRKAAIVSSMKFLNSLNEALAFALTPAPLRDALT
jgi:hypothetical protein